MRLIDADDVDNHIVGSVNLSGCPTINAISIPDNITNLDMMLKVYSTALIYKSDEKEVIVGIDNMFCQKFDRDWCDAPYKGVST